MIVETYSLHRQGVVALVAAAVAVMGFFVLFSSGLVNDLEEQERQRMELWAEATRRLAADSQGADDGVDFMLSVIEANRSIPVMLVDSAGTMLLHRNFDLPDRADSLGYGEANRAFLEERLEDMRRGGRVIPVAVAPGEQQYLYYEDSRLLRRLNYYPYLQILLTVTFVGMVYFAVATTKRSEQNKVWVGLSKETAHQLGTPISSLMAWNEILRDRGDMPEAVEQIDADVRRLADIAARFSKIGSKPKLQPATVGACAGHAVDYMRGRVSRGVEWSFDDRSGGAVALICPPLLEWVMECLIKNAVDAMEGRGRLSVSVVPRSDGGTSIEVTDSGHGLPRKRFRTVFRPGFTTKERGWGLGLTLARRIVDDYHGGRIYVNGSVPGYSTTFRIDLPRP